MNGHDNLDKEMFWQMEKARPGIGRRRFKVKEVKRTIAVQRKAIRKRSFASRVQDPWNQLSNNVQTVRNPQIFRRAYRKAKNLV